VVATDAVIGDLDDEHTVRAPDVGGDLSRRGVLRGVGDAGITVRPR
jgi:hypothetical protein